MSASPEAKRSSVLMDISKIWRLSPRKGRQEEDKRADSKHHAFRRHSINSGAVLRRQGASTPDDMTVLKELPSNKCSSCSREGFAYLCPCILDLGYFSPLQNEPLKVERKHIIKSSNTAKSIVKATERQDAEHEEGKQDRKAIMGTIRRSYEMASSPQEKENRETLADTGLLWSTEEFTPEEQKAEERFDTILSDKMLRTVDNESEPTGDLLRIDNHVANQLSINTHMAHQLSTIFEETSTIAGSHYSSDSDSEAYTRLTPHPASSTLRRPFKEQSLRQQFSAEAQIVDEPESDVEICETATLVHIQVGQAKEVIRRKPVRSQTEYGKHNQRILSKSSISSPTPTLTVVAMDQRARIDAALSLDLTTLLPPTTPEIKLRTKPSRGSVTVGNCKYCKRLSCSECPPITKTVYADMAMSKTAAQAFVKCNTTCAHGICARTTDITYFRYKRCDHDEYSNRTESITHRVVFAENTAVGEDMRKIVAMETKPEIFCVCCQCKCVGEGPGWQKVSWNLSQPQAKLEE
jgi:hypothetical protein